MDPNLFTAKSLVAEVERDYNRTNASWLQWLVNAVVFLLKAYIEQKQNESQR